MNFHFIFFVQSFSHYLPRPKLGQNGQNKIVLVTKLKNKLNMVCNNSEKLSYICNLQTI